MSKQKKKGEENAEKKMRKAISAQRNIYRVEIMSTFLRVRVEMIVLLRGTTYFEFIFSYLK